MTTPASIAKHPIHPMLVGLPIGLWISSLAADFIGAAGWGGLWKGIALYTMTGGIVGALLAAIPGAIDFFSLKERKSRRFALYHLILNLTATAVFAINAYLRMSGRAEGFLPLALSIGAIALVGVGGWLGGELVYIAGVGVDASGQQRRNPPELRQIPGGRARRIG